MKINFIFLLFFILSIAINTSNGGSVKEIRYSYWNGADNGPDNWAKLDSNSQCDGRHQSPINIQTDQVVLNSEMNFIKFYKEITDIRTDALYNVGFTVGVQMNGLVRTISDGGLGSDYTLRDFHFHWANNVFAGSEHSVNGNLFPLEIHFVHWNSGKYNNLTDALKHDDGIAVLGVLVKVKDADNDKQKLSPGLAKIAEFFEYIQQPGDKFMLPDFSFASLFPTQKNYYRYHGSLTTPPCYEVVTWTVFKDPIYASEASLEALRDVKLSFKEFTTIARPTQPTNDREVTSCCDSNLKKSLKFIM